MGFVTSYKSSQISSLLDSDIIVAKFENKCDKGSIFLSVFYFLEPRHHVGTTCNIRTQRVKKKQV